MRCCQYFCRRLTYWRSARLFLDPKQRRFSGKRHDKSPFPSFSCATRTKSKSCAPVCSSIAVDYQFHVGSTSISNRYQQPCTWRVGVKPVLPHTRGRFGEQKNPKCRSYGTVQTARFLLLLLSPASSNHQTYVAADQRVKKGGNEKNGTSQSHRTWLIAQTPLPMPRRFRPGGG